MTIVEQYEAIMAKCEGVLSENELAFLKERAELHAKKNASRKPSKVQTENEGYKEELLKGMEIGKTYTITDLIKSIPALSELTNQRVSALIRQLKEDNLVLRTEVKGKAYFAKA